jgi:hypothetical protein
MAGLSSKCDIVVDAVHKTWKDILEIESQR